MILQKNINESRSVSETQSFRKPIPVRCLVPRGPLGYAPACAAMAAGKTHSASTSTGCHAVIFRGEPTGGNSFKLKLSKQKMKKENASSVVNRPNHCGKHLDQQQKLSRFAKSDGKL
jgi:hypothetical protein